MFLKPMKAVQISAVLVNSNILSYHFTYVQRCNCAIV